ncbi:hypothetical protein [Magnetococcus sp. PR-3]|uniref:hypothetical protein n=1 Tax=Magnetococcus sp. PR-3 TaxID=3120355 RepID=UPI002FCE3435
MLLDEWFPLTPLPHFLFKLFPRTGSDRKNATVHQFIKKYLLNGAPSLSLNMSRAHLLRNIDASRLNLSSLLFSSCTMLELLDKQLPPIPLFFDLCRIDWNRKKSIFINKSKNSGYPFFFLVHKDILIAKGKPEW